MQGWAGRREGRKGKGFARSCRRALAPFFLPFSTLAGGRTTPQNGGGSTKRRTGSAGLTASAFGYPTRAYPHKRTSGPFRGLGGGKEPEGGSGYKKRSTGLLEGFKLILTACLL